jgi:hypothetical protein
MRLDKKLLEKDYAYHKSDTVFSAKARLKQSQWRKSKGYPKQNKKLGNYLDSVFARTTKNNFLTDKIKTLVQYEIYSAHQYGKLISEPRIWENLLSSQPLAFNLFGELHFDLKLATKFLRKLYPDYISEVTKILFEHSPSRADLNYTGDHSAFDVFIEFLSNEKQKGFIGIEVKYAENMSANKDTCKTIFDDHGTLYTKLAYKYKIFSANAVDYLKHGKLQQIWRDHLLAIATLKDYDLGFFVFLYPKDNLECDKVVTDYQKYLISDSTKCAFVPARLEDYVNVLLKCSKADWINDFKSRYLI